MTTPPDGTQPNPELASTGTPNAELANSQTGTVVPPPDGSSTVTPSPELAALQAQLADAEKARQTAEQQARDHQAAYTRSQQQLRAMAGVQPEQNPLQPFLERACRDFGLSPEDPQAIAMARRDLEYRQELNRLHQSNQAQVQLPAIVEQVCLSDKLGRLLQVKHSVQSAIQSGLANGSIRTDDALDPNYVRAIAAQMYFEATGQPNLGSNQPVPNYQQPPAFNGMTGGNFQGYPPPSNQQQQQINPQADELEKKMAAYLRLPPPKA
jgi:hypothetical protein